MNLRRCLFSRVVLLAAISAVVAAGPMPVLGTALDDYVAAPDSNYAFSVVSTTKSSTYTTHVLDMKSQQWRTAAEVHHPVWNHWLIIVVPDTVISEIGLLVVDGGSIGGDPPTSAEPYTVEVAKKTQTVVAELRISK